MLLGECCADLAHQRRRVGRQVEIGRAFLHARKQPVVAERDLLDLGRAGQRGEDDLALLGERLRRVGPDRAGRQILLGRGAADVVDDELVAGLLQVGAMPLPIVPSPMKPTFMCVLLIVPLPLAGEGGERSEPGKGGVPWTTLTLPRAGAGPLPLPR